MKIGKNMKLDEGTSDVDLWELKKFYETSKNYSRVVLVCVCLFIFLIPLMVAIIMQLVWSIKCLLVKNDELRQDAILWGVLGLILPVVPIFVMKHKTFQVVKKYITDVSIKI